MAEMFYPDVDQEAAAHACRQLVYRLRKMGVDIDGDSSTVTMATDEAVWDIEQLMLRGHATESEIVALQRGYLEDYRYQPSGHFTRWLDDHRAQVTTGLRHVLVQQIQASRAKRDFRAMEAQARACLALDPLNEEATLAAAEALAAAGSKADAVSMLDQYLEDVGGRSRDLRIAPRILRERISTYRRDQEGSRTTLVGREAEVATINSCLDQAFAGSARACLVWGPAGIGKTRLIEEASSHAFLLGYVLAQARLSSHDIDRPFSILRDLGPALLDLPGSLGASPESLATVRGLCGRGPSVLGRRPANALDTRAVAEEIQHRVIEVVSAIAEEQPIVLWIEDADRLDSASSQMLSGLLDDCRKACVLLASRRPLKDSSPLIGLPPLTEIRLKPLSLEDSRSVVRRLMQQAHRPEDLELENNAISISAGVPLFLHLLVKNFLASGDAATLPSTLTASLTARLDELVEPTKSVFDAIVILGGNCTVDHLETVAQLPRFALAEALRTLEETGFVRVTDGVILPSHDLLGTTSRGRMPKSVSRLLHRSAALALEPAAATGGDPLSVAGHWEACGENARAVEVVIRHADSCTLLGRPHDAITLLDRARRLAASPELERRVDITMFEACHAAGEDHRGVEVSEQIGILGGAGTAEHQIMAIEMHTGAAKTTVPFQETLECLAARRELGDALRGRAARMLAMIAEDLGDSRAGARAVELISDLPESSTDAVVARLIHETVFGSVDRAIELATRLYALALTAGVHDTRIPAISTAGFALLRCGEVDRATQYYQEAYDLADARKIWSACTGYATILGYASWMQGDRKSAEAWLRRSTNSLERSSGPDRGHQQIALGILLALDRGDAAGADAILESGLKTYASVGADRFGFETFSYRIRIDIALGRRPSEEQLEELLSGHRKRRHLGLHDPIADTLIGALCLAGRLEQAAALRDEYLSTYRREQSPVPRAFRHLRSEATPSAPETHVPA
jgi:DNA-binding SARP family transcriptional activator/tetratricopeptide (TPR) repeat protein